MAEIAIAVDGPGSSGKGTVARGVARALGYSYIDTGSMYRSVALIAREQGTSWEDGPTLAQLASQLRFDFCWDGDILRIVVNERELTSQIRNDDVGVGASRVSSRPEVRQALLELQRALGRRGGVVMDGRDIGTVVLPEAQLKIYLDAAIDERARRRHDELMRRGDLISYQDVFDALDARDRLDKERPIAPLRQAEDAVYLDSSSLTIREATDRVLELAISRGATLV